MEQRTERYAATLAEMIRHETVSRAAETEPGKFKEFRSLLKELFPALFGLCGMIEFENGFVLRWKGRDENKAPVLFMNHHDVVEAGGNWKTDPFSGAVKEGRIWGRGTLDDKGGLWAMLQAAEEMIEEGFVPGGDIWFSSSSTEETTGKGAEEIARWFESNGVRFRMSFDEGGFIVDEPVPGAKGSFALIGVGEKGCADLRFVARSNGGHSSMPEKNSPLVRLGKFMAEADESLIFTCEINPAVCEMFRRFSARMGEAGALFAHPEDNRETLCQILSASPKTAALLRTTLAFTMAHGSEGTNVIPAEAWVVGNMRFSHHQGQKGSFEAVRMLAEKYGIEMQVLDPGTPSGLTDYNGTAFRLTEDALGAVFPGVIPTPYLLTGASDSRFFDGVCDQCIRFLPFLVDDSQAASIHGLNENLNLDSLAPAVDFYKLLMKAE